MTILNQLSSAVRRAWFAAHGVQFGRDCRLENGASLVPGLRDSRKGEVIVGDACELLRGACLHAWGGRIALGERVFVGPYAVIYGHGGVEIGRSTLISMHCRILSSNHAVPPAGTLIRSQPDELRPTRIGADVWLGAGVTVLGGVTIGDGCVVGAGAVVTKDLPAYSIAVGVPALATGKRPTA
jgi:acetyltransferase-like isoleucine patch superfamily enzyme